jgi:hypothetical protein
MEAVLIASAGCARTNGVLTTPLGRGRSGLPLAFAALSIGLAPLLNDHVAARGQLEDSPAVAPADDAHAAAGDAAAASTPRTILARSLKLAPRPGASAAARNPSRPSEASPPAAPTSVAKPPVTRAPHPQEKRFKVRDDYGRLVVARLHGQLGDKIAVVLPDGKLGFPTMYVPTDEPFSPMSADDLAPLLQQGPFAEFLLLRTEHYLIFYQSSLGFAQDSGRLLEDVYRGLIDAFRRNGIPVHESEFPLVAVIYATDHDFKAQMKLEPQVRAYYEFFTNRISFYQRSERDQFEPKVAALLKPQTVAHEGVHQVLCNIGVQPRLSHWPLWLVEGMAEYCASTKTNKKGIRTWAGLGGINSLNMATLRELDDPLSMEFSGGHSQAFAVARQKSAGRTETLVTETHLTPTDYALAWSLTHYLARTRCVDFVKYLKHLNQLPPLEPRSPEQQLADFRKFFGDDLAKIDKKVDKYVHTELSRKEYEPLKYYAVTFEQTLPNGAVKRAACVNQSPQMIQQWILEKRSPHGGEPVVNFFEYPTRARAMYDAERWINGNGF